MIYAQTICKVIRPVIGDALVGAFFWECESLIYVLLEPIIQLFDEIFDCFPSGNEFQRDLDAKLVHESTKLLRNGLTFLVNGGGVTGTDEAVVDDHVTLNLETAFLLSLMLVLAERTIDRHEMTTS